MARATAATARDVRRGVPGIFVDSSLDSSIARRHAIAAASSQCHIRAGRTPWSPSGSRGTRT